MYHDLHLLGGGDEADSQNHRERLAFSMHLGWDAAATSQEASGPLTESDICSIEPIHLDSAVRAAPGAREAALFHQSMLWEQGGAARQQHFRQFSRLTAAADDITHVQTLLAPNAVSSSYDIVSVLPLSERVFTHACSSLQVDIITLNLAQKLPFHLRPKVLHSALDRGVHFEICYSPALRDPTLRRHVLSNAAALATATRGHGLVISSGARSAMELRGPHDVINLGTLFGLTEKASRAALTTNCRAVLAHAAARRSNSFHKGVAVT